jgi:hypothetical protein
VRTARKSTAPCSLGCRFGIDVMRRFGIDVICCFGIDVMRRFGIA